MLDLQDKIANGFAEREGFEPSDQYYPVSTLAPCRTRPLCDLSFGANCTTICAAIGAQHTFWYNSCYAKHEEDDMDAQDLFTDFAILPVVAEIEHYGISVIPHFVLDETRNKLLAELEKQPWLNVPEYKGQRLVRQDFRAVVRFPENGLFMRLQESLAQFLNVKFARCEPNPISEPLCFNEMVAQRYLVGTAGIGPHRDESFYINVVAIIVLEGEGRFCICENNDGGGATPIPNSPGSLLLMRGYGFCGSQQRPIHFVDRIETQRTTVGLRHKQKKRKE